MNNIAVLIPVYNDFQGLILALNSIQVPQNACVEAVIVDDGSKDAFTLEPNHYPNIKINIIRQNKNTGIVGALNNGLKYITENKFEYVARLDAGDVMTPNRLQKQLDKFNQVRGLMLLGGAVEFQYKNEFHFNVYKPLHKSEILKALYYNSAFCHTAVMFKSELIKRYGGYSSNYEAAEDYEFFWRIAKFEIVANLGDILVKVDNNPKGISISRRGTQLKSRLKIQMENFNFLSIHSWLGVIKTFILKCLPQVFINNVKRRFVK